MKRSIRIFVLAVLISSPVLMLAQTPPHPGGNPTTSGNTPVGGAAPIENGTFILFTLALAYIGRKVYVMRKTAEE
jgi:hypothetical protein